MNKEQIRRIEQARDIVEMLNYIECPHLRQIFINLNIVLKEEENRNINEKIFSYLNSQQPKQEG